MKNTYPQILIILIAIAVVFIFFLFLPFIISPNLIDSEGQQEQFAAPLSEEVFPEGVEVARGVLADRVGVSTKDVIVLAFQEAQWQDGCLGLAEEDELCTQVITPGYHLILQAGNTLYIYRTNGNGSAVRYEAEQRFEQLSN